MRRGRGRYHQGQTRRPARHDAAVDRKRPNGVTFEAIVSNEQAAKKYEHVLHQQNVRHEERRRVYFDRDILPRERQLHIQFGDRCAGPGAVSIIGKIYALAVQARGAATPAKCNRFVIIDAHATASSHRHPIWRRVAVTTHNDTAFINASWPAGRSLAANVPSNDAPMGLLLKVTSHPCQYDGIRL